MSDIVIERIQCSAQKSHVSARTTTIISIVYKTNFLVLYDSKLMTLSDAPRYTKCFFFLEP